MALLGNYTVLNKNPGLKLSGSSISTSRSSWNQVGEMRGRFYGEGQVKQVFDRSSLAHGYRPPYTWVLAPKSGGVGSTTGVKGVGTISLSNLAGGLNGVATLSGSGTITSAAGALILSAIATLSGIGNLSADTTGSLQASATLAGSGNITGSLGALAFAISTLSGSGTITSASQATAKASVSATISPFTVLSPESLSLAVWQTLATQFTTPGTMAYELLNASGGGGGGATPAQIWEYSNRTLTESAGLSTDEHNKLFSLENSTGGGYRSSSDFNANDRKLLKDAHDKVMNLENANIAEINEKLNEIDSHIELAKEETIDTIKEVETEVCSDIIRKNKELKEDNITTRNLVRQKTKKIDENVSKLADRQEKTDKMIESEADEIEKLIEQNIDFEADEIEKQIQEQIDKEIEEIESNQSNQSNDGNNNGTEGEVQGTPN